ncbi:MAG: S41 family peptidase [Planctomycetota bacterium]|nr:S41 family peptidase [Planctomycetota bacterium]
MIRRHALAILLVLVMGGWLVWAFGASTPKPTDNEALFREADRFIEILRLVQKQYVNEVETEELFRDAIDGMLGGLDPFSNFIPAEEVDEFDKATRGKFGGIGIQIGMRRGLLTVISPLEGTPAYEAGVLAGDMIIEIDGKSTDGIRLDEAVKTLTGEAGTKVTITVRHVTGGVEKITITRALIEVPTVKGLRRDENNEWVYMIDEEKKIGYVRVASFVENSVPDLRGAVEQMQKDGMKALILDLRFDPGGILKTAVEMTDLFLDEGVIVKTKGRTTPYWEATATKEGTLPHFPMVVLVNQYSASASEIVSGALQDHHRAIILGERTFGKGSVQNVIPLKGEKSRLKLTTSKYYLPSGRCIHREQDMTEDDEWGVVPDIVVSMTPEQYVALIRARREGEIIQNNGRGDEKGEQPADPDEGAPKRPEKPGAPEAEPEAPSPEPGPETPGATPGAEGEDAAKEAEPFVDTQLQRALDVLRSIEVIEKYLKAA